MKRDRNGEQARTAGRKESGEIRNGELGEEDTRNIGNCGIGIFRIGNTKGAEQLRLVSYIVGSSPSDIN